jgi:uncharacterized secreted protein with C-terminal beta-propeller domain
MKTFDERTSDIMSKIQKEKNKQRQISAAIVLSVCVCLIITATVVLFTPYDTTPPDVSMYADSDYYDLIQQLNKHTYKPPQHKNNYEYLISRLEELKGVVMGEADDELMYTPEADVPVMDSSNRGESVGTGTYIETTDNQVQGVIEADLIKRSDQYIYYLRGTELSIYSIAGAQSMEVSRFEISFDPERNWFSNVEMYLSQDCTTVTVFCSGHGDEIRHGKKDSFVCIVSLDVSNPMNVKEVNRQYITGAYLSSRKVDGTFLIISRYQIVEQGLDFDDITTFLPQVGQPGNMVCVGAEDIIAPDILTSMNYTVVTMINEKGLAVADAAAFLSYSNELYVSESNIFATHSYSKEVKKNVSKTVTEISGLTYTGGKLEKTGSIVLDGSVKNQYSMDEHKGILRVVTSTAVTTFEEYTNGDNVYRMNIGTKRNVNLYAIGLSDWSVKAKVEAFAPEGETAESVRFDGDVAYVCTAEVITLTDPVYYFDLSDLSNITWKDTGTIDGYSSSLVNFGDHLLGIGYNEFRDLKIEIYRETEDGIVSVCSYELPASFSEKYKSYLIDREKRLVGLHVYDYEQGGRYLLLGFDGAELRELISIPVGSTLDKTRAVLIENWLYLLTAKEFKVEKVW